MTLHIRTALLIAAGFLSAATLTIGAKAETADKIISAEDLQQDFEALYEGLKSAHYDLYVHRPQAEYDALFKQTLADLNKPLSLFEAQIAFQKFLAYGNVAHARIDLPSEPFERFRDNGGRVFPIYPRIVDGRFYIGELHAEGTGLQPGDEIIAINGAPARAWLARTAQYISADTDYIAHSLLEFRFPFLVWLEAGELSEFQLEVRADGNKTRTVRVNAITQAAQKAAAAKKTPGFIFDGNAREAVMLEDGVAYLKPGPFYNVENPQAMWDNAVFAEFIDSAFERFIAEGATRLLIDLRENPGGDNSFSDLMVGWIADRPFTFISEFRVKSSPEAEAANRMRLESVSGAAAGASAMFAKEYANTPYGETFTIDLPHTEPRDGDRYEGEVYVLINRHSYSNAVNVAALIQDYDFGVILGEETSDFATTYGAMESFQLPRTGITVGFPKARLIRPSGDEKAGGVRPDIAIASPIAPVDNDVVLNAALDIVRNGRKK